VRPLNIGHRFPGQPFEEWAEAALRDIERAANEPGAPADAPYVLKASFEGLQNGAVLGDGVAAGGVKFTWGMGTVSGGLTVSAAGRFLYSTAVDTWAEGAITAAGRALLDDADAAAQRDTLELGDAATKDVGTAAGTVAAGDDSRITGALQSTGNQTLTGGFDSDHLAIGDVSSGTVTPAPKAKQIQAYTNRGAHTLAPPASYCSIFVDITNGSGAGAITAAGFTKVDGDTWAATVGQAFRAYISVGPLGSHLTWKRMV
jgi:hypothetical protein